MSPPPLSGRGRRIGRSRRPALLRRLTLSLFAAALIGTLGAAATGLAAPSPVAASNWSPVHTGDFPDPSVLLWEGVYYGFATQSFAPTGRGINVQVSTSTDGVHWIPTSIDALPQVGSWAEEGETWAPSVAYDSSDETFVMYYTATEASTGDQCIGVATSLLPLGPYSDDNSTPVVCQDGVDTGSTLDNGNYGGSIDPDIFTDPATGDSWLIWKSDGNHIGMSTIIWSVELSSNLTSTSGSISELLQDDQPWQSNIIEGPDMVETQTQSGNTTVDDYYLFYSGSDEGANTYSIGWATCPGPSSTSPGPACTDATTSNPLLATQPGMSGPGGPDVYTLPGGQLVMALAAWQGTTIGYLDCGFRPMYLASLTFGSDGTPSLGPALDTAAAASPTCPLPPAPSPGYWQVAADGGIFSFGGAQFYGSTGSMKLNQPVVGMASTADGRGYWLVAADGGVFNYGDAGFYGSTGSIKLNKPIIGLVPTLDGHGYWLIASDGGVFAFGDAPFYGSTGGEDLDSPVTGRGTQLPGRRLLARRCQRAGVPLRRRTVRGATVFRPGRLPHHGPGRHPQLRGLLAGQRQRQRRRRGRRGTVRLRVRHRSERADRRHRGDDRRSGLLAPGRGRRHLHLRRRAVPRVHGRQTPERAHGGHRHQLRRPHARPTPCAHTPPASPCLTPRPSASPDARHARTTRTASTAELSSSATSAS